MTAKRTILSFFCLLSIVCNIHAQEETNILVDTVDWTDVEIEPETIKPLPTFEPVSDHDNHAASFRKVPDSLVKLLQQKDEFWYANEAWKKVYQQQKDPENKLVNRRWFRALMWVIMIGAFVAAILYYLSAVDLRLFRRRSKKWHNQDEDPDTDNIFEINYHREISRAVSGHNYRLAIRLNYLKLLRDMSTRGLISYQQGKTNFDYLVQLSGNPFYKDFSYLTRLYEFSWYGKFDPGEEKYRQIEKDFSTANNHWGLS